MEKYIEIFGLILIILIGGSFLFRKKKRNKLNKENVNEIINLLGGVDNIVSVNKVLSRINVIVNEVNIVDAEKIKIVTKCGVMIVNNKVQIILNDSNYDFNDFESIINKRGGLN